MSRMDAYNRRCLKEIKIICFKVWMAEELKDPSQLNVNLQFFVHSKPISSCISRWKCSLQLERIHIFFPRLLLLSYCYVSIIPATIKLASTIRGRLWTRMSLNLPPPMPPHPILDEIRLHSRIYNSLFLASLKHASRDTCMTFQDVQLYSQGNFF